MSNQIRGTRSSKAVAMLRAKYRWCLTGTPVTNTLYVSVYAASISIVVSDLSFLRADIYGLLRFGHFRPWK